MTRRAPVAGRADPGGASDDEPVDAKELAIADAAAAALRGETAAISRLPRDLQPAAHQRFTELADAERRAQLRRDRANPLTVDPAEGLH